MTAEDARTNRLEQAVITSSGAGTQSRIRPLLAALALLIPTAAVFVSGLAWRDSLPEQVAFHWDALGRPNGAFPAEPLYWMSLGGAAAFFLIGVLVLLVPGRDDSDTRKAATILGTVAGFAAAAWIVPAGVTFYAESAERASLGGWMLLFVLALMYGLLPRLLLSRKQPPG